MASEPPLALVTGASRGIGAALAAALAASGHHLLLTGRDETALVATEDRIHAAGGTATIAPLDLSRHDDIDRLADAVAGRWGRLDLLVLDAAQLGTLTPLAYADPAEFANVLSVNLVAQWRLVRAFDPLLRRARGTVVALTSAQGSAPRAYWGAYAISKAGLEAMAAIYAAEMEALGVRVLLVNPGATRTAMRARAFPGEDPLTVKDPETVAAAVVDALSGLGPGLTRLTLDRGGSVMRSAA